MPRRPRPADRPAPGSKAVSSLPYKPTISPKAPPKQVHAKFAQAGPESNVESEHELGNDSDDSNLSGEDVKSGSELGCEEGNEDIDVDAPRVAQWEPDEFETGGSVEDDNEDDEENPPHVDGPSHQNLVHFLKQLRL
jgi:ribosomal RNA-processing protein 36